MNNKPLEYSAIRSEENNKFTIFVQVPDHFKDKEIDVTFNALENTLVLKGPSSETHSTEHLPQILTNRLKVEPVQIVFCDSKIKMIGKCELMPPSKTTNISKTISI